MSPLANILICGATKSGTTTLWGFFEQHPEACVGSRKELHFFDRDVRFDQGISFYNSHYSSYEGEQAVVDATPNYLYFPKVPRRIDDYISDARIIFIFRNPIERTYSAYWHDFAKGRIGCTVEEAVHRPEHHHLVEKSRYAPYLHRYLEFFSNEQVLILLTDELKENADSVRKRCYQHAGIDDSFVPDNSVRYVRNKSTLPRSALVQRFAYQYFLSHRKPEDQYIYNDEGRLIDDLAPDMNSLERFGNRLYAWIKRINIREASYPPMDKSTRNFLVKEFREDIEDFASVSDLDVSSWMDM